LAKSPQSNPAIARPSLSRSDRTPDLESVAERNHSTEAQEIEIQKQNRREVMLGRMHIA